MIIALHGFLGLPGDWTHFDGAFKDGDGRPLTIRKWDLYADLPEKAPSGTISPLRTWARAFCDRIRSGLKTHGGPRPVLIGYSMGGRLALHALSEDESLFSAAVIVGAHPGLTAPDLRMQRRLSDAGWAERFRSEDWSALLGAWGGQEVFSGRRSADAVELRRLEIDFDRTRLARAMLAWSLAEQDDLRPELADLRLPVLWLTGESDRRFDSLYAELRMDLIDSLAHHFERVSEAGHRAPWDNPPAFAAIVQSFLNQVP